MNYKGKLRLRPNYTSFEIIGQYSTKSIRRVIAGKDTEKFSNNFWSGYMILICTKIEKFFAPGQLGLLALPRLGLNSHWSENAFIYFLTCFLLQASYWQAKDVHCVVIMSKETSNKTYPLPFRQAYTCIWCLD